ncbi:hypothetical protein BGW38_000197 [Lunasporangiospora selenospora]|uniref:Uncharacterized protein n=1 Tax=Lunasporangiospora selenospora TaxID=979761 RepID=A0A9P6FVP5_9FUNG|nr:hypothetical protein BGW38_000197 [Lunasporangiospora selenospora]
MSSPPPPSLTSSRQTADVTPLPPPPRRTVRFAKQPESPDNLSPAPARDSREQSDLVQTGIDLTFLDSSLDGPDQPSSSLPSDQHHTSTSSTTLAESSSAPIVTTAAPSSQPIFEGLLRERQVKSGSVSGEGLRALEPRLMEETESSMVPTLERLCLEAMRVELDLWQRKCRFPNDTNLVIEYQASVECRRRLEKSLELAREDRIINASVSALKHYHQNVGEIQSFLNVKSKRSRT